MNMGLQGKAVLISGGSKGIGRSIAFALAAEGARLALCAREEVHLKQTADEIHHATHTEIVAVKANMTRLNDIRRFVDTAFKKFGRIDILINNAGSAKVGGLFKITDEEWEYNLQLKLLGYIRLAREVIPHMKKNGGGKIINIIGLTGKEPDPLYMLPGATNAALLNFTKSLAKELEQEHIIVNAVNPGTTDTPLTVQTCKSLSLIMQKSPEVIRQTIEHSFPQKRIASPEDIAGAVVFLSSQLSNFINGTSVNVDAGKSFGIW